MKKEFKNLVVRIPRDLHNEFKSIAAHNGMSMQEIIIELIISYVDLEHQEMER